VTNFDEDMRGILLIQSRNLLHGVGPFLRS